MHKSLHSSNKNLCCTSAALHERLTRKEELYKGMDNIPMLAGPWGGKGGSGWDDGLHTTIRQLVVTHGMGIDSIQIEYVDSKGSSVWSAKHGGNSGSKSDKIMIDYPDEFLTSISGYYGSIVLFGPVFLRSLTFISNRKTYGPLGTQQGSHFSFSMTNSKIVGFHGRCGWYLDSIGVHMRPIQQEQVSSKAVVSSQYSMVSGGTDHKSGYNFIQGSVGDDQGYDIVLAIKPKEKNKKVSPNNFSIQSLSSPESSEGESNEQIRSFPPYVDKGSANMESSVTYGPWGGNGGTIFDDGASTGIRQVNLTRSSVIVSIKVLYDKNGLALWGHKNGGTGGIKSDKIVFDYPFEVLTHISGYYGTLMYMGPTLIKSLTFHTNKKSYGPYGSTDEQGTPFSSDMKEGKIVGFHGKKGYFIDSIGVHVMEGKLSVPKRTHTVGNSYNKNEISAAADTDHPQWSNNLVLARRAQKDDVTYGFVKEPAPCGPGPWGGDGGRPWDDGVFTGIKQIFLTKGEGAICSMQIEYDRNGQSVWSIRHGGGDGESTNRIKFEYPHEVIICISGYYGSITKDERPKVVRSLTFYTSRGKYGPFGEEIGTFFTSTTTEGKVVGFHGRSSLYLDAIGVHMQHWLGDRRPVKSMFSKLFY